MNGEYASMRAEYPSQPAKSQSLVDEIAQLRDLQRMHAERIELLEKELKVQGETLRRFKLFVGFDQLREA
jgi:hypothetical protein